jgi:formylglycine-generating enzyme required for sulfatase activity
MLPNHFLKLIITSVFAVLSGFPSLGLAQEEDSTQNGPETHYQAIPGTEVGFEMVLLPAGTFTMGSPDSELHRKEDEGPQREVALESFWIGKYEMSFDVYEIFREKDKDNPETTAADGEYSPDAVSRPSPPYEDPTFGMGKYGYPAVSMTQYAALKFCKWLYDKTGVFYRLPTEAEWEYACRAGTNTAFYFGDDTTKMDEYGWYYENSDGAYHKLGEKKPNPWGIYDMHGNVAEWTLDQYQVDFYASLNDAEPNQDVWSMPTKLHPRTVRGGSWDDDIDALRSAARTESSMDWKRRDPQLPKSFWWNTDSPFVGFRLIKPAKTPSEEEVKKFWRMTLDE